MAEKTALDKIKAAIVRQAFSLEGTKDENERQGMPRGAATLFFQ